MHFIVQEVVFSGCQYKLILDRWQASWGDIWGEEFIYQAILRLLLPEICLSGRGGITIVGYFSWNRPNNQSKCLYRRCTAIPLNWKTEKWHFSGNKFAASIMWEHALIKHSTCIVLFKIRVDKIVRMPESRCACNKLQKNYYASSVHILGR